jgi:citrate lyase subunit beta/citryl-CoA lyase
MSAPASREQPVWRSLLFVPSNNERFIDKAHTRGADLADAAGRVGRVGTDVLVRINSEPDEAAADLDAAVQPGVRALLVPKVEDPDALVALSADVSRLEAERGMADGGVAFVVLVESAAGLLRAEAIARAEARTVAMELGGEDFALSAGMLPDAETLAVPKQMVLYAARAAGLVPLGILGSIAHYGDLDVYRATAERSRRFGFEGAACIHPSNVPVLNDVFTPAAEDVERARRLVDAYAEAERAGSGAISVDGNMIDVPVVIRAQKLLARHEAIRAREAAS